MEYIITELKLDKNPSWNGYTETIYETYNTMYQMIYIDVDDAHAYLLYDEKKDPEEIKNMVACYLSSEKKNIHGKCIIIKYK